MYVDDMAVHVIGTSKEVAATLVTATGMVIKLLEIELVMVLSRRNQWATEGNGKTEVAVTDPTIRVAIEPPMRRLGVQMKTKSTHIGVPFRPGAKTRTPSMSLSRWAAGVKPRVGAQHVGRR